MSEIFTVTLTSTMLHFWGFPGGSMVKNPPANAGDKGDASSIPGSGRSPEEGNGSPLQYSCLENPMDRGGQWATVHRVAKSQTLLKQLSMHTCKLNGKLKNILLRYGNKIW